MGYVLRVRFASFCFGAAATSVPGFYILHNDYKSAYQSFSEQIYDVYKSLDGRISSLEEAEISRNTELKETEVPSQVEATE